MISPSLASSQQIWNRLGKAWQSVGIKGITSTIWSFFWMGFAGLRYGGRIATWLATWFAPPYKKRRFLARYNSQGYIAPSATIHHGNLQLGANIFIGDRVKIIQDSDGGAVHLADRVHLHDDIVIQTGNGGSLKIGRDTHIQPRCQFAAYETPIQIGCGVQIAPHCVFESYSYLSQVPIIRESQPSSKQAEIIVNDDVWIGHGSIISPGVQIGKGAVIGSGAVVTQDIPEGAIAAGIPARVINFRSELVKNQPT